MEIKGGVSDVSQLCAVTLEAIAKIERSGWEHECVIVGATPLRDVFLGIGRWKAKDGSHKPGLAFVATCPSCRRATIRREDYFGEVWPCLYCGGPLDPEMPDDTLRVAFAHASNITQWKPRQAHWDYGRLHGQLSLPFQK